MTRCMFRSFKNALLEQFTKATMRMSTVRKLSSRFPRHMPRSSLQSLPAIERVGSNKLERFIKRHTTSVRGLAKCSPTLYHKTFDIADDLIQTTTVTKLPGQKIRAQMDVQTIRDMKLHIKNILAGKQFLENVLDKIINGAWQPGFVMTRGLINELVSTAFSEIFNTSFRNFPFDQIFRPSASSTTSVTSSTPARRY